MHIPLNQRAMYERTVCAALNAGNFPSKNATYDSSSNREGKAKYDEFIKEVQTRGHMESRQEAERTTQATLETLAERLAGGEPHNLASQLPPELAEYMRYEGEETSNPFSLDEFFERVSERDEGVDPA